MSFEHIPVGILRFRAVVRVTTHLKSLKTTKNHAKTMKKRSEAIKTCPDPSERPEKVYSN